MKSQEKKLSLQSDPISTGNSLKKAIDSGMPTSIGKKEPNPEQPGGMSTDTNPLGKDADVKHQLECRLAESWLQYQALKAEFDEVVNSTTWRMTAPVRICIAKIRRLGSVLGCLKKWRALSRIKKRTDFCHSTHPMETRIHPRNDPCWYIHQKTEIKKYPPLDIGVVTYNNRKWLPNFMRSLSEQQYPLEKIALIIVDHSSQNDTLMAWRDLKKQYEKRFRCFTLLKQTNKGFGAGQNLAFSRSTAPYYIVSNVDLEFEPDALVEIIGAAIREGESLGSLEFRQKPYEHPKYYDPVTLETAWSAHSCVLFSRDALIAAGGYEERFFMYGEDTELSYRIRDKGFRVKYCPKAVVWHYFYQDQNPKISKPLQFKGNTIANSLIRLRYGAWTDIFPIPYMYLGLIKSHWQSPKHLEDIAKSFGTVLKHGFYFLNTRKQGNELFSFHKWDFEIRREGTFYHQRPLPKKTLPMVSIIIRTSTGQESRLEDALLTVAAQTYSNIELILLKEDTTECWLEKWATRYPFPFTCCRLPAKGRAAAWNKGLSLAKGTFLMVMEDNDMLFSDHVEILVNALLNESVQNQSAEAAYSLSMEMQSITGKGSRNPYPEVKYHTPRYFKQPFDRARLLIHNYIPPRSLLFHRNLYERYGGFDEHLEKNEDWELWLRYSRQNDFLYIEKTTSLFSSIYLQEKEIFHAPINRSWL